MWCVYNDDGGALIVSNNHDIAHDPDSTCHAIPLFWLPRVVVFVFLIVDSVFVIFSFTHERADFILFCSGILSLFFPLRESMDMKNLCVQKISDNQHVEISPVA